MLDVGTFDTMTETKELTQTKCSIKAYEIHESQIQMAPRGARKKIKLMCWRTRLSLEMQIRLQGVQGFPDKIFKCLVFRNGFCFNKHLKYSVVKEWTQGKTFC